MMSFFPSPFTSHSFITGCGPVQRPAVLTQATGASKPVPLASETLMVLENRVSTKSSRPSPLTSAKANASELPVTDPVEASGLATVEYVGTLLDHAHVMAGKELKVVPT